MVTFDITNTRETEYFKTSLDHVLAELNLLALRLQQWVKNKRQPESLDNADKYRGLYISDKEVDDILNGPGFVFPGNYGKPEDNKAKPEEEYLQELSSDIASGKQASLSRGIELRLDSLQKLFSLSQLEIDTLLICLLSEVDMRYQKLYAFLQDDVTKKAPTVNLVIHFLYDSLRKMFQVRDIFAPEAPLLKHCLISLHDDRVSGSTSLMSRSIHLDERISGFLLGRNMVDYRISHAANLISVEHESRDLVLPEDTKKRLHKLISNYKSTPLICCLSGAYGTGQQDIVEAVCYELGVPVLVVNVRGLLASEIAVDTLVPLVFREGALRNAIIYLESFSLLTVENKEILQVLNSIIFELCSYPYWVILDNDKEWQPDGRIEKPCINVKLSGTGYAERLQIWEKLVENDSGFAPEINVVDLAGKFRLNSGQIAQVVTAAKNLAKWRDPDTGLVTNEDLYSACRKQSGDNLNTLTRKVSPVYRWEDIVLPKDQMEQLHEICSYIEHYHTVYDNWGFGRKLSLGKGLKVLFAGPSGTGKTMAAEVIASELQIDLYKIDLSTIVSKYIGETEKNLEKIFREGQTSNAILFFDEADALFGKRSEVRDAHDRYANVETAYLLQKMDEYEGTVILATNLRKNMDEAFARRMHYTLEFPLPEEPDRYRIWRQVFPRESPLDENIDYKFLARRFKISGGNIKNIALNAAFLAAANGKLIGMENLVKATKREYQKIGKLCTEDDFGQYYEMVKN